MKYTLIFLVAIILLPTCRKESLPDPIEGDPVFMVSGSGVVDITAGQRDFYLFTDYQLDSSQVYNLIASFEKLSDCEIECDEAFRIEIRNSEVTPQGDGFDLADAIRIGNYDYVAADSSGQATLESYSVDFSTPVTNGLTYEWDFGDNSTGSGTQVQHTYSSAITNAEVCLTITFPNACFSTICRDLNFSEQLGVLSCNADFVIDTAELILDSTFWEVDFRALPDGPGPFTYNWNMLGASDSLFTDVFVDTTLTADTIFLEVQNGNGCTNSIFRNVLTDLSGVTLCSADWSIDNTTLNFSQQNLQLGEVTISYTNSAGINFRSDLGPQPDNYNFRILREEAYLPNENGESTRLLEVSFNVILYSVNGEMLELEEAQGVIAVAYPG